MRSKAASREYAIFRSDGDSHGNHGWLVNLVRRGAQYAKYFSDGRWGGREKALAAARLYRDEIDRTIPRPSRVAINDTLRRNNRSGIPGVCRSVFRTPLWVEGIA